MDILVSYIKKTKELLAHLEKGIPKKEQDLDEYIEKINWFLEERKTMLLEMPDLKGLEEHTKQELVQMEKKLQLHMKKQMDSIKGEIKILQLKKQKNDYYANPYENVNFDGTFFDKKK